MSRPSRTSNAHLDWKARLQSRVVREVVVRMLKRKIVSTLVGRRANLFLTSFFVTLAQYLLNCLRTSVLQGLSHANITRRISSDDSNSKTGVAFCDRPSVVSYSRLPSLWYYLASTAGARSQCLFLRSMKRCLHSIKASL